MLLRLVVASAVLLASGDAGAAMDGIEAAKAHFAAGSSYYEQGRYEEALKEFREAYSRSERPALLYNIALCHERMGKHLDAVLALEQYLVLQPDAEDRGTIDAKIAELEKKVSRRISQDAAASRPAAPPSRPLRTAGWVLGAVGVALLGGAAGTGLTAWSDHRELQAACGDARDACPPGSSAVRDRGQLLAQVTDGLIAGGGAALATGVALLIVDAVRLRERGGPRLAVVPAGLPGGAGLLATLRF